MAGRNATVAIAILADANNAVAGLRDTGAAADTMSGKLRDADRQVRDLGESIDKTGSTTAQAAGGLGDLAGVAELAGFGKLAGVMDLAAIAVMGVTGAADLAIVAKTAYNAVLNSTFVVTIRTTAATVAHNVAVAATAVVTRAAAVAQWAWNAAMTANPIVLIVTLLAALVALFVTAYRKSETFRRIVDGALQAVARAFTIVRDAAKAVFTGLATAFRSAIGVVTTFRDRIVGIFRAVVTRLANIGRDMMRGLVRGITAGLRWVRDKIRGIGRVIPEWLRDVLGMSSPSRVMADLGRDTMAGLIQGIDRQVPKLRRTLAGVSSTITGLSANASVTVAAPSQVTARSTAGATTYNLTVQVPPTVDTAEVGREVVRAVEAYERRTGRRRLVAA